MSENIMQLQDKPEQFNESRDGRLYTSDEFLTKNESINIDSIVKQENKFDEISKDNKENTLTSHSSEQIFVHRTDNLSELTNSQSESLNNESVKSEFNSGTLVNSSHTPQLTLAESAESQDSYQDEESIAGNYSNNNIPETSSLSLDNEETNKTSNILTEEVYSETTSSGDTAISIDSNQVNELSSTMRESVPQMHDNEIGNSTEHSNMAMEISSTTSEQDVENSNKKLETLDISHETLAVGVDEIEKVSELTDEKNESENVEEEWLDILGNGKLKKKILCKGKGRSSRPIAGDIVEIRCEGKLANGTVVDKQSCLQFILSDEDVIQAFDLSVALMEDKEVAIVRTDARYAYGIYGRPDYLPPIPQNADITYEVEVLSVRPGKSVSELSVQERILYGNKKRIRGNDLYSTGDFSGSINAYKRGLRYLEGSDDSDIVSMKVKCLNNLSAAQLKVKAYNMAIQSLNSVLFYEPDNVKALFRKGKCYDGLHMEKEALESMKMASSRDPNNKLVSQELNGLRARVAAVERKEKEIYQRMFQQNKPVERRDLSEGSSFFWPAVVGSVAVAAIGVVAGLVWFRYR